MGYVVAAYAIVLGSLVAYGLRIQMRRRARMRSQAAAPGAPGKAPQ